MKEIEVKAVLKNKEAVIKKLESLGCIFNQAVFQDSIDYCHVQNAKAKEYLNQPFFLRLRTTNGKHEMSIKKPIQGEIELSKIEHQTNIENRQECENLIEIMGYFPALRIRKERIITHYKDYEICLDQVEELGSFIEVEKISDKNPADVRLELQEFLFSLGVNKEDEVFYGYDTLLFQKQEK